MCESATAPYLYVSLGHKYFTSYVICWTDMSALFSCFPRIECFLPCTLLYIQNVFMYNHHRTTRQNISQWHTESKIYVLSTRLCSHKLAKFPRDPHSPGHISSRHTIASEAKSKQSKYIAATEPMFFPSGMVSLAL